MAITSTDVATSFGLFVKGFMQTCSIYKNLQEDIVVDIEVDTK